MAAQRCVAHPSWRGTRCRQTCAPKRQLQDVYSEGLRVFVFWLLLHSKRHGGNSVVEVGVIAWLYMPPEGVQPPLLYDPGWVV